MVFVSLPVFGFQQGQRGSDSYAEQGFRTIAQGSTGVGCAFSKSYTQKDSFHREDGSKEPE